MSSEFKIFLIVLIGGSLMLALPLDTTLNWIMVPIAALTLFGMFRLINLILNKLFRGRSFWKKQVRKLSLRLDANPTFTRILKQRADAYIQLGDFQNAIEDWNTIVSTDPNNSELYYGRAFFVSKNIGNHKDVLSDIDVAIKLKSENARYWAFRSVICTKLTRDEEAKIALDEAIKLNKYWSDPSNFKKLKDELG